MKWPEIIMRMQGVELHLFRPQCHIDETVWRPTAVFVPHPGELEPVHVAPAQWRLFL